MKVPTWIKYGTCAGLILTGGQLISGNEEERVVPPYAIIKEERCSPIPKARPKDKATIVAGLLEQDMGMAIALSKAIVKERPDIKLEVCYEIAIYTARYSRNYGLDPWIMISLIKKESNFKPNAKSRTGDHGLCQLHNRRIYGIEENIVQGFAHFRGNLTAAGGDVRRALSCYNGGPRPPRVSYKYADSIIARANKLRRE